MTTTARHGRGPFAEPRGSASLLRATPEEAQSLLRDGLVRQVIRDVYVAGPALDCAVLRARGVRLMLEPAVRSRRAGASSWRDPVLGHLTAAWIHAGGPPPHLVDVVSPPGRARWRDSLIRIHEYRLLAGDIEEIAGLYLTGPVRTAADLVRSLPADECWPWLGLLAEHRQVRPLQVLDQLERMPYGRGVRRGRDLVHLWAAAIVERGTAQAS